MTVSAKFGAWEKPIYISNDFTFFPSNMLKNLQEAVKSKVTDFSTPKALYSFKVQDITQAWQLAAKNQQDKLISHSRALRILCDQSNQALTGKRWTLLLGQQLGKI